MTRAEKAALKAYPAHDGASEQWKKAHLSSLAEYIQGYEQAEKDLTTNAIDAEIVKDIHNLLHVKSGPLPMPAKHRFGDRVKILILEDDERTPHNLD